MNVLELDRAPILVLASTSPRRKMLLTQVGLKVKILSPSSAEIHKKGETAQRFVRRLALEKAESVIERISQSDRDTLVVAADTVVVSPDGKKILGKPKNDQDAARMLRSLSGKTHTVLTGYSIFLIRRKDKIILKKMARVVRSKVKMRALNNTTITRYIATREPHDKAGSYGAQGIGVCLIEKITGSHANVVGLPVMQVLQDLEREFSYPLLSWT